MSRIAVALSGGGHRAALFGLGALMYLVDAGKSHEVTSVSSVSGGSLTNGCIAQTLDYASATPDSFRAVAERIAGQLARRGTLWATLLTWLYLAALVGLAIAVIVVPWFLPMHIAFQILMFVAGLLVVAWLAKLRGWVCARVRADSSKQERGTARQMSVTDRSVVRRSAAARSRRRVSR